MTLRSIMIMITLAMGIVMACQSQQEGVKSDKKPVKTSSKPHVLITTNMGEMEVELYPEKAPVSVKNFLDYVNEKFYDNTIFHRVIYGFMIQGGGFTEDLGKKNTKAPIPYEGDNGLSNLRGTIAYARTQDPNSATSQFFINHRDNFGLNHGKTPDGNGYTVFGKVVRGIDVVDKIASIQTGAGPHGMRDVPVKTVTIQSIRLMEETAQ